MPRPFAVAASFALLVACGRNDKTNVSPDPAGAASCPPCPACGATTAPTSTTSIELGAGPKPVPIGMLPAYGAADAATESIVAVTLDDKGTILVNGVVVADADLASAAKSALAAGSTRVVITADGSVPYAKVIRVVDVFKAAGATKIAFGVAHP